MSKGLKFRLFLLTKLPSAYFSGLRMREMTADRCKVSVPFSWFSKNPFKSTYFACLGMAAEMSTGALALSYVHNRNPRISMLVRSIRGVFHKKATGLTYFTCEQGKDFETAVQRAIDTHEAQEVTAHSIGRNESGELIAEFYIEWGFKARQ